MIDVAATKTVPTPKAWQNVITAATVDVLPLLEPGRVVRAGWCTSGIDLLESPDVEVMCGGTNSKAPHYAAVWRQGNLLHFGFEPGPSEFNAMGRALLENAIVYAARFTEDRPILTSPSGFVDRNYARSRYHLRAALEDPAATAKTLANHFTSELQAELLKLSPEAAKIWIRGNLPFLASGEKGRLAVDEDGKALGIALDESTFTSRALAAAAQPATSERALALLARRIPEGPGTEATTAAWRAFLAANSGYLFFTETGGYVWRLDPLAQKRGVPTAELRGSRRAS